MNEELPDTKRLGYYFALAQVGLEMVVPIGLGAALDYYVGWGPWGTIVGAIGGLTLGVYHIVTLSSRFEKKDDDRHSEDRR